MATPAANLRTNSTSARAWTPADIASLIGKTALVTGANRGLGLEIAKVLAGAGANVVLACRDAGRAASAVDLIRHAAPEARVRVMSVDLADQKSVRRFAD